MRFIICACLALTAAALRPSPVAMLRTPTVQRSRTGALVAQQLPPGWYTTQDPNTGQTYYCNEQSGQCQWDPPQSNQGAAAQLPPGWYTTQDPNTGQTYYCSESTGQCQWDPPQA